MANYGPHEPNALSSVMYDIAPLSPIEPTHSGPETRGSLLSIGYLRGSMQCIGRYSTVLSWCKPESIEASTSSLVGDRTLHPMFSTNSLAVETLFRTLNETLRWCESHTESRGTIALSCLAATREKVASITLIPES